MCLDVPSSNVKHWTRANAWLTKLIASSSETRLSVRRFRSPDAGALAATAHCRIACRTPSQCNLVRAPNLRRQRSVARRLRAADTTRRRTILRRSQPLAPSRNHRPSIATQPRRIRRLRRSAPQRQSKPTAGCPAASPLGSARVLPCGARQKNPAIAHGAFCQLPSDRSVSLVVLESWTSQFRFKLPKPPAGSRRYWCRTVRVCSAGILPAVFLSMRGRSTLICGGFAIRRRKFISATPA